MSLWVYLTEKENVCEHCGRGQSEEDVFAGSVTHSLATMANEADIYNAVWRPEETGIRYARDLIEPLQIGIALMEREPERFVAFERGMCKDFISWLKIYLEACEQHPNAYVRASR